MSDVGDRPLRIFVDQLTPGERGLLPQAGAASAAGFDYAALAEQARLARDARAAARRRRAPGEPAAGAAPLAAGGRSRSAASGAATPAPGATPPAQPGGVPGAAGDAQAARAQDVDAIGDGDDGALAGESARAAAERGLGQDIVAATWPVVEEVARVAESFAALTAVLAREVAAFCADPAIGRAGNWDARIALDQRTFAHTTLHLQLSQFRLALRFDAADAATRQLICDHGSALERELRKLMVAWGEPRDIDITVW